jgi:hypothetical protein
LAFGSRVAAAGGVRGGAVAALRDSDCLERLALVLQVRLRRLDEVRDEVVPSLQLHVYLAERVSIPFRFATSPL